MFSDEETVDRTVKIEQRTYITQRIYGLPPRKITPNEADLRKIREDAERIRAVREEDRRVTFFTSGFVLPVEGRISGEFGSRRILNGKPRSPHHGVDIAAPEGTPVVACADGTAALVDRSMYFTGVTVMVDHGHGLSSVYAHLSAADVQEGDDLALVSADT